jgi:hypothetical protein
LEGNRDAAEQDRIGRVGFLSGRQFVGSRQRFNSCARLRLYAPLRTPRSRRIEPCQAWTSSSPVGDCSCGKDNLRPIPVDSIKHSALQASALSGIGMTSSRPPNELLSSLCGGDARSRRVPPGCEDDAIC